MRAGFDMDFYLDWRWAGNPNGYNILLRNTDTPLTRGGDALDRPSRLVRIVTLFETPCFANDVNTRYRA